MSMTILLASIAVSVIGGFLALFLGRSAHAAKVVACLFGMGSALLAVLAGFQGVIGQGACLSVATPFSFADFTLLLNPIAGLLLAIINVLAFAAFLYGLSYFDEYKENGLGAMGLFMNLFIASMNVLVVADNAFWFLVFFELMSLTSYFLVVVEQKKQSIKGGFMYLVMAHVGFLMIMISYFIMASQTGSFEFAAYRVHDFGPVLGSLAFVLAFFGFGCKAGMVPFHSWLPQAHPAAPSNVSALMSGGMIKIGVFGIIKVGLDLLSGTDCMLWWGLLVLVVGAVSSVLGVVYALGEHDIKKLLAYHSVENIGIILLGVGLAFIGVAMDQPALAGLALLAGIYHMLNHAMFKGLLFLGAGSVLYATGTRNMEKMGGLIHAMPVTAMCFLIGSLAISAIPPLNGFVSEWFTYQAMFSAAFMGGTMIEAFAAFAAVALAVTGALAVTCFVKAYGVTFLGVGRSDAALKAKEVPASMTASMVILSIVCIFLGLGAPLCAPVLEGVAASVLGGSAVAVASGAAVTNGITDSVISTPLVAVLLIAAVFVALGIRSMFAKGGSSVRRDPWACGYKSEGDMPVIATTFASEVKWVMGPLYAARGALVGTSPKFVKAFESLVGGAKVAETVGDKRLVDPVAAFVDRIAKLSQRIEAGDSRLYIVYIVVALVALLIATVALMGGAA
ncbi:hydrogenase 4 subunit B [Slackia exigua]|uniref:hydrogenase 4 subunit B n=1 Tax=Slackia exigua TaxID=84109 RepID=UPI00254F3249|nr:hydrogenase 4 subunit B [Slackia exigua]MDK7723394.1 hydrogenase 4 subunit B [Slackia exigua]MDK7724749.1 hydrogenase 4 subunit B [Slackia exigua]